MPTGEAGADGFFFDWGLDGLLSVITVIQLLHFSIYFLKSEEPFVGHSSDSYIYILAPGSSLWQHCLSLSVIKMVRPA